MWREHERGRVGERRASCRGLGDDQEGRQNEPSSRRDVFAFRWMEEWVAYFTLVHELLRNVKVKRTQFVASSE
jgi:hypothetical protein